MAQKNVNKVLRYGWRPLDEPGKYMMVDKHDLHVDPGYQRDAIHGRITKMASEWSWVLCEAIIVGFRDNKYWVIEGQHRVLAARERRDIAKLPCLVFRTETVAQEAKAFVDISMGRKFLSIYDKFRAKKVAGDETALWVQALMDQVHVAIVRAVSGPNQIAAIGVVLNMAEFNRESCKRVVQVYSGMARDIEPLKIDILSGLWYVDRFCVQGNIATERVNDRIRTVGLHAISDAIARAKVYYGNGGDVVCARGIINAMNKAVRSKFELEIPERVGVTHFDGASRRRKAEEASDE